MTTKFKWILIGLALLVSHPLWSQTKEMGPRDYPTQSCTASPATGYLRQCADTVTGNLICVNSSGGSCSPGGTSSAIAGGTIALPTTAIAANTCGAVTTATATGALTSDTATYSYVGDPTGVTGYGGAALIPRLWTTAGAINVKVCNTTAASVTPGAQSINWLIPARVSSGGGGSPVLTGALSTPSGTQNLTTLGTADWAHWGFGSVTGFDHKSAGGSQISNYTLVGTPPSVTQVTNNPFGYTWTDGTPTASATATTTGIFVMNPLVAQGFSFTAPATTTTHTLLVYIGVYFSRGQIVAHLSDSSAADYADTGLTDGVGTSGGVPGLYTLTYRAASTGQTLTVTYLVNVINGSGGNVSLNAAALQ